MNMFDLRGLAPAKLKYRENSIVLMACRLMEDVQAERMA